ncbi:MAG: outer membrane protein transport protein [Pseudomonadota bacterium]
MKQVLAATTALSVIACSAYAGGVERNSFSSRVLFEDGRYAEFSFGGVSPSVSGTEVAPVGADASGGMAPGYFRFGAAYKADLNENLSYALIFDEPFGAGVNYAAGTGYFAEGSTAFLYSYAVTALLKYTTPSDFSVYGGLRVQTLGARADIPFIGGYTANGAVDEGFGYLVGVAYERPEIALRAALTYTSSINHQIETAETSATAVPDGTSTTSVNTPQSLKLELQSGVAEDTLVFGSVNWVNWSNFDISPTNYGIITTGGSLVSYDSDTITYTLGVGRRLNDNWSVSGSVGYEAPTGGFASNLGPTDGSTSVSLGAQYSEGNMTISGGVSYIFVGSAETTLGGGVAASDFSGNNAIGAGIRVGMKL